MKSTSKSSTSQSSLSHHKTGHTVRYAAANTASDVAEAETIARDVNKLLQDPRHNGRQLYLKQAPAGKNPKLPERPEQGAKFLSTNAFSSHERALDWFVSSSRQQSEAAREGFKSFATQLTAHRYLPVQKAAADVLAELNTGRAAFYGGVSSSGDLRTAMLALVAALDAAPDSPEPAPLAQQQGFRKDHRAYSKQHRSGIKRSPPIPREFRQDGRQMPALPAAPVKAGQQPGRPPAKQAVFCCAPPVGDQRFGPGSTTREDAALHVHQYLSQGAAAPEGPLYLSVDNKGAFHVGARAPGTAVSPNEDKAGREAFAQFLKDLCEAFKDHPNPEVRSAAATGVAMAKHGVRTDLRNVSGMRQLFKVLAETAPPAPAPQRPQTLAVATTDQGDKVQLHARNAQAISALLRAAPRRSRLCAGFDGGGVLKLSTRAESDPAPQDDKYGEADVLLCQFLANFGRRYANHTDPAVRASAQQLQDIARASLQLKKSIRASSVLAKDFEVLAAKAPEL